jgi:hypothetical protein
MNRKLATVARLRGEAAGSDACSRPIAVAMAAQV